MSFKVINTLKINPAEVFIQDKLYVHTSNYANVHSKFVFIIAKHKKRHQIPSTSEWINCGTSIQWCTTQQWKGMNTEIFNKMDER